MKRVKSLIAAAGCLCLGGFAPHATAAATLTGDTNRPEMSMFIPGEKIELSFKATGLDPNAGDLKLHIGIVDEYDQPIKKIELPVTPSSDGSWSTTVPAPGDKMGFYRVNARLSNGIAIAPLYSRPGGFLSYGVVVDPAKRQLYPEKQTFFGMQGGFSNQVQVLPYLGIRWVMGPGSWANAEPNYPGQFADNAKKAAAKGEKFPAEPFSWCRYKVDGKEQLWQTYFFSNGLGTCCVPTKWKPEYPSPYSKVSMGRGILSPDGEKYFTSYCRELAKAIAKSYPDRDEHIYEITWEPDLFFPGTLKDIVRYYELAYPAIHEEDPKAVIMGPCATVSLTKEFFDLGLGKYLDAFSLHYTFNADPEKSNAVSRIRELKALLKQCSGKEIPIMSTESGRITDGTPAHELYIAQGEVRSNLIQLGEGFRFQMAFYIADMDFLNAHDSGYGYFYNLNPKIKFGTTKTGPKPVAPAYAAMTYLCDGRRGAGAIEWLGDTVLGYAYERYADKNDILLALWDFGDKPREIALPVGTDNIKVLDWMGNELPLKAVSGTIKLTLTNSPLYIQGVSSSLWGKDAVKPVQMAQSTLNLFPGSTAKIEGSVSASQGNPIDGILILQTGAAVKSAIKTMPVKLAAGKNLKFAFDIAIPEDAELGNYTVSVNLQQNDMTTAAAGCVIKVQEPLQVGAIRPSCEASGKKTLSVAIAEVQGRTIAGTVNMRITGIPESEKNLPFKLSPGQKTELLISYDQLEDHPARLYDAKAKFTMASGYTFARTGSVNFLSFPRFATPPTLDGNLKEWAGIPGIELNGKAFCRRNPQFYSGDSAIVRYAWDDQNLYLAVTVKDQNHLQNRTGELTWMGDALQCGFNLDPFKEKIVSADPFAIAASQPRYSAITLALTSNGPEAYCHDSYHPELRAKGALSAAEFRMTVTHKDGETVYEAALPWKTLGAGKAPQAGDRISVDMSINDRDTEKQSDPSALYLFNGINHPDIRQFGVATLAP